MRRRFSVILRRLHFVGLWAIAPLACHGAERPPNHPVSSIQDRAAMRIDLVSLAVSDEPRAARVKALYEQINALWQELEATRRARLDELRQLDARRDTSDDEFRRVMVALRDDGRSAFRRYVALQLELRQQLEPDEFARLDATR